jgi:hypothetical protein
MSRVLCALMLALSVALLALGPTAVFAAPPCPPGHCYHGSSSQEYTGTCTGDGCTETNKKGNHCFTSPGNSPC